MTEMVLLVVGSLAVGMLAIWQAVPRIKTFLWPAGMGQRKEIAVLFFFY